ncbi:uncharacterized protein LOC123696853 [Colias croceus]|uniref:uncharacterized protein LOC119833812 n=1 Tax=Zerene cesonia TaxID=33412 RepID=UPI0018E5422C|nr:uncharacterized protein LOC119833812 [Zerene cesonia]XP_045499187.1 uncharacterized protein LOC123696853 [Colias croceus]
MKSWRAFLCIIILVALHEASTARLPVLRPIYIRDDNEIQVDPEVRIPAELVRARVREGVPPPLCAGRCAAPRAGPVCAFDAAGTARTFATLCELEAVSCRESTYYAITSLGEC